MKKIIVSATLLLMAVAVIMTVLHKTQTTNQSQELLTKASSGNVLTVAMDINMPGYFSYEGQSYGFQYDILSEYAEHLGKELNVVPKNSIGNAVMMLENNEVDIVVTMPKNAESYKHKVSLLDPLFKTSYVVMANKKNVKERINDCSLKEIVDKQTVMFTQSFTATESYDYWLDSVSNTALITYDNSLNLMSQLQSGNIDFFVCEKLEADLGCYLYKDLTTIHNFEEEVSTVMLVKNSDDQNIGKQFNAWIAEYRNSENFEVLYSMYCQSDIIRQIRSQKYITPVGGISPFDDIIKEKANTMGMDWRLISAIAYHESRFNSSVVSNRGAKGIMQIMPSVAKQFDVNVDDMVKPDENIELAIKLLCKIEKSLRFASGTSDDDRISIILACYNGGIGHVIDARRLASKYGANPNSWEDVAKYLKKKSDEIYYTDDIVKNGKFKGIETVAFVKNVMSKYYSYCSTAKK